MNQKHLASTAIVGAAIVFLCAQTEGALNAYLKVTGAKQGAIKGSVTMKGREGSIGVIAFDHEVVSPRDAASGLPTGKRQHKPVSVVVEWDQATPRLYQSLFTGESLPSVSIEFYAPQTLAVGGAGGETNHMTVKLTNASIASLRSEMLNNKDPNLMRFKEACRISFSYQKIEYVHPPSGATGADSWGGGPGGLVALLGPQTAIATEPKAVISLR